jgi:hypothetical protein
MERNNPLKVELAEKIKNDENPNLSVKDFLDCYMSFRNTPLVGEYVNRVIKLDNLASLQKYNKVDRFHIIPKAGKQGEPITIINVNNPNRKEYNYKVDWSATYDHNIYIFSPREKIDCLEENEFVMIFHRKGGSGCKSVFYETATKVLKQKGIKIEMDWKFPLRDSGEEQVIHMPTKINLKYEKDINSSDIADYINGKRKKRNMTVKELILDLRVKENDAIARIIRDLQMKKISKKDALLSIRRYTSSEYNSASITLRIGNTSKKVKWEDFENLYDGFEITNKLQSLQDETTFSEALGICVNDYYCELYGEL